MEDAVQTVMTQCELWTDNNDMENEKITNLYDTNALYNEHNDTQLMVAEQTDGYGEIK